MTEEITARVFRESDGVEDWRVVGEGAISPGRNVGGGGYDEDTGPSVGWPQPAASSNPGSNSNGAMRLMPAATLRVATRVPRLFR